MRPISLPMPLSSSRRLEMVRTCLGGSSRDQLLIISELIGVFIGMNLYQQGHKRCLSALWQSDAARAHIYICNFICILHSFCRSKSDTWLAGLVLHSYRNPPTSAASAILCSPPSELMVELQERCPRAAQRLPVSCR